MRVSDLGGSTEVRLGRLEERMSDLERRMDRYGSRLDQVLYSVLLLIGGVLANIVTTLATRAS